MKIIDQIFEDLKEDKAITNEKIDVDKQPVIKSITITEVITNP